MICYVIVIQLSHVGEVANDVIMPVNNVDLLLLINSVQPADERRYPVQIWFVSTTTLEYNNNEDIDLSKHGKSEKTVSVYMLLMTLRVLETENSIMHCCVHVSSLLNSNACFECFASISEIQDFATIKPGRKYGQYTRQF